MPRLRLSLAVLLCTFAGVAAQAQLQSARSIQPGSNSLTIGAGDLLSMHIFREDDLDTKGRVKDDGTIALPLIGTVRVEGLSTLGAASAISARYSTGHFLNDPQVSVLIEQSAAEQVAVLGDVGKPGVVLVSSPRSLLDVLAEAGGLLRTADRHITIRRPGQAPITVLIPNEASAELASAPILVSPGDTVLVPRAGIVYVLGDVGRPGGYLMQDDARLSLLQALALASGATRTASQRHARLIRTVHGQPTEIPLRLKAIESGKLPDLPLQNDDIVYIPFSFGKNLALGAPSIAASASSALVYAAW